MTLNVTNINSHIEMAVNHRNENTREAACSLPRVKSEPFGYPAFYSMWHGMVALFWKLGLDRATHCLWCAGFEANWRACWKDNPKLGVCIVSKSYCKVFPSTTLNVNITIVFWGLRSILLLLSTTAILGDHRQPYWRFQWRHKKQGENFDI